MMGGECKNKHKGVAKRYILISKVNERRYVVIMGTVGIAMWGV